MALDFGFLELAKFSELAKEQPNGRQAAAGAAGPHAVATTALRLNNNELSSWDGFQEALGDVLDEPQARDAILDLLARVD